MKTTTPRYMAVQGAALLIACVFLTVGLLGFIPGVTTDHGLLQWSGHQPGAKLFGVFAVSGVHNVVHLAFGGVGLMLTRTYAAARAYLLGGGLAYLALWTAGIFIDQSRANFGPVNGADHWLHFGLGAAMVVLGLTTRNHLGRRGFGGRSAAPQCTIDGDRDANTPAGRRVNRGAAVTTAGLKIANLEVLPRTEGVRPCVSDSVISHRYWDRWPPR